MRRPACHGAAHGSARGCVRRAGRHGRWRGMSQRFLWDMTGRVVSVMGEAYPEIREAQARVAEAVRQEEERFAETLDLGMAKIREYLEAHRGDAGRPGGRRLLV